MKRLVVCCDGTWKSADQESRTNVVKFASAAKKRGDDGVEQIVSYDEGVGTRLGLDRWIGGAFGAGLFQNVCEAYRFIANNYEPGDHIFLFGFSRGAYTVRSVAGMIRKCGVLRKAELEDFAEAFKLYRSTSIEPHHQAAQDFRRDHAVEPGTRVRCIGVWDTVGALGIPGFFRFYRRKDYEFHDVRLSRSVDYAFQALAIDEKRKSFLPAAWEVQPPGEDGMANILVEQAWFPGAHSNVGGGARDTGLSDATLLWMAERAAIAGLELDGSVLSGFRGDYRGAISDSRRGIYRLWRPVLRAIGAPPRTPGTVTNELIAGEAEQRWDDPAMAYRPGNLADYFRRHPRPGAPPPSAPEERELEPV